MPPPISAASFQRRTNLFKRRLSTDPDVGSGERLQKPTPQVERENFREIEFQRRDARPSIELPRFATELAQGLQQGKAGPSKELQVATDGLIDDTHLIGQFTNSCSEPSRRQRLE